MKCSVFLVPLLLVLLSCSVSFGQFTSQSNTQDQFRGCTCPQHSALFGATLSVEEQIPPPVNVSVTSVGGGALFRVLRNETDNSFALFFELFANADNITSASLHLGLRCATGPVVAVLAGGTGEVLTNASNPILFVSGNITESNFTGALTGAHFFDLILELENGNAYVEIGTLENPGGTMRGQVQLATQESLTSRNLSETLECAAASPFNSTFLSLLSESGLVSNLTAANHTIFAPTEFAWDVFGRDLLASLDQQEIKQLVSASIVEGIYSYTDFLGKVTNLTALDGVTTLVINGTLPPSHPGPAPDFSERSLFVTVNGILITEPDMIVATDAIVQGIDGVITPNITTTNNTGTTTGTTGATTGTAATTGTGAAATGTGTTGTGAAATGTGATGTSAATGTGTGATETGAAATGTGGGGTTQGTGGGTTEGATTVASQKKKSRGGRKKIRWL